MWVSLNYEKRTKRKNTIYKNYELLPGMLGYNIEQIKTIPVLLILPAN